MPSPIEVIIDHRRRLEENLGEIPENVTAHELLQLVYRGKVKLTPQQLRAAEAALPYESPKLSAVGYVRDIETFATRLELAIQRSQGKPVKLIEARVENADGSQEP
jgi:hypothetical protein